MLSRVSLVISAPSMAYRHRRACQYLAMGEAQSFSFKDHSFSNKATPVPIGDGVILPLHTSVPASDWNCS